MTVIVRVDHKLRITRSELPQPVLNHIVEALSIPNIAREEAQRQRLGYWEQMPETINLWSICEEDIVMPRGFGQHLALGLKYLGIDFEIEDHRFFRPKFRLGNEIGLRPWQENAMEPLRAAQEGIWKAPAGSGKTVGILALIKALSCRSIVIVNTKDILWQWKARADQFLGPHYPVGQIGDGVFEPSGYLTVATAQTLHSRFYELEADGFFDGFSFLCLDECHHATADTYNRLVNRFSCRYRIGISATPDKTGDFALATNVLGPVIHETKPSEVTELMRPSVFKIPTQFSFGFRKAKGMRSSNYPELLKRLTTNKQRNELIARVICAEEGRHSLVLSKRLEHIDILQAMVIRNGFKGAVLRLTGEESNRDRELAVDIANRTPCVIFSTLADEALDIPRLDRLFLVYPQKNSGLITQQVGRIERVHPEKEDAIIYDFCDLKIRPLENQWMTRRWQVYEHRGYEVHLLTPHDIEEYLAR